MPCLEFTIRTDADVVPVIDEQTSIAVDRDFYWNLSSRLLSERSYAHTCCTSSSDYWFSWMFLLACELLLAPALLKIVLGISLVTVRILHAAGYGEEGWFDNWLLKISHADRPNSWALVSQEEFLVKPTFWQIRSSPSHYLRN